MNSRFGRSTIPLSDAAELPTMLRADARVMHRRHRLQPPWQAEFPIMRSTWRREPLFVKENRELAESSCNSKKHRFSIGTAFNTAAQWTSRQCGRASTFAFACVLIVAWAATGPIFQYSDTWQLVINTGTTIVTFLMVFLIQNTQNRDSAALHLKLDELIRANRSARNELIDLESLGEAELLALEQEFQRLRAVGLVPRPHNKLTAAK